MPELGKDVKSNSASSAASAGSSGSQEGQSSSATKSDALEGSSTSSGSKAGDKSNVSMAEFVKQTIAQKHGSSTAEEDETGEGEGEGESGQEEEALDSKIETDEKGEEGKGSEEEEGSSDEKGEGEESEEGDGEGEGEEGEEGEGDGEGEGEEGKEGEEKGKDEKQDLDGLDPNKPVPYKRLKQVVDQKNALKKELEVGKQKMTNFDSIQRFCQTNNIQPTEFQEALRIQSLISTGNFSSALEVLEPLVAQLKGVNGDVLPADLQQKLTAGEIDEASAKELAKLRAQTKLGERNSKQQQQALQRQQQMEFERSLDVAANNWVTSKLTSDPDFKPKKSENAVDGKYEEVQDKYQSLLNKVVDGKLVNVVTSAAEMVALLNRAYNIVNMKYTNSSKKKSPTGKRLSSAQGSSTISQKPKKIEEAGSMAEAIQIGLNQNKR